jgi:putative endonuclease
MCFVYVLRSTVAKRQYVGSCADVNQRLGQHNAGLSSSTKHWRPWVLVYQEHFASRADAMRRERYFKTGKGREELDRTLAKRKYAVG